MDLAYNPENENQNFQEDEKPSIQPFQQYSSEVTSNFKTINHKKEQKMLTKPQNLSKKRLHPSSSSTTSYQTQTLSQNLSTNTYSELQETEEEEEVEVIFFKSPEEKSVLFVEHLTPKLSKNEVEDLFSQFGLLYDVSLFQFEGSSADTKHAFVKYYSRNDALNALKNVPRHLFRKINFSKSKKTRKSSILDIGKSVELANHFIGFNQWSTSILSLTQEEMSFDEATQLFHVRYSCKVKLVLRDGRSTEGVGAATGGSRNKDVAMEFAKKNALTDARKKVFQNLVIVKMKNKVLIHFLTDPIPDD
jgi:RNA recognition motif-containing protein